MKKMLCLLLAALFVHCAQGQDTLAHFPQPILRLRAFGERLPQEKVYVHMDNRCYFIGDTIWFAAYTRQTNNDTPSELSGTLYVELFDQEGYLKERKLVEMTHGRGHGFFATDTTMYGGFYELRAYTRWQLNWGEYEHRHKAAAKWWYFNAAMRHEHYRDYDKLYSRTFPVYDRQQEAGAYDLEMTPRPLERASFSEEEKAVPTVRFYPEGGSLVQGLPCRVVYEAALSNGAAMEGSLLVGSDTVPVENRGRGVFTLTPAAEGVLPEVSFIDTAGVRTKCSLPKAELLGVSLRADLDGAQWVLQMQTAGDALPDSLFVTLMHQGVLRHAWLASGGSGLARPTVRVDGETRELEPYQPVELRLQAPSKDGLLSLAIRDGARQHGNYDNGSILAEMLLCSEIKGFVPQPDYFFEADDAAHRRALDLLMLTQGWRRFNWKEMGVRGEFELLHPAEKTPVLTGVAHKYDLPRHGSEGTRYTFEEEMSSKYVSRKKYQPDRDLRNLHDSQHKLPSDDMAWKESTGASDALQKRMVRDGEKLKRELKVHVEFLIPGSANAVTGDAVTEYGRFRIKLPRYDGECFFHLAASDTTKWTRKEKKDNSHVWIQNNADLYEAYPEYYVRLSFPYPLFVKPYHICQTRLQDPEEKENVDSIYDLMDDLMVRTLKPLTVNAQKRSGLMKRMYQKPAVSLDVYEAFNLVVDAGLMDGCFPSPVRFAVALAYYFCSDMGSDETYNFMVQYDNQRDKESPINGMNPKEMRKYYNYLYNLDSVYVYTSYSPRLEGSDRYKNENIPDVRVQYKLFKDLSRRTTYRDRYMKLPGYALQEEFYHPDYSTRQPSPEQADYRRTLYWNPNLKLDAEGKAQVRFYNNARTKRLAVEAAGMAPDGAVLWNKSE